MTRYIVASWPLSDELGNRRAQALRAAIVLRSSGWRLVSDEPGFFVAVTADDRSTWRRRADGRAVLLGRCFDRTATDTGCAATSATLDDASLDPRQFCRLFVERTWGSYVLVQRAAGSALHVLRDPLGGLDCLSWRSGSLLLVSNALTDWIDTAVPDHLAIDWPQVAAWLAFAPSVAGEVALAGVVTIPPGTMATLHRGGHEFVTLWTPAKVCAAPDLAAHPEALAECVDACASAWLLDARQPVAEISGGLDSAIVAASVVGAVKRGYHYFASSAEGDERGFARAVASANQVALEEIPRSNEALVSDDLSRAASGARPALSGMDVHHDHDLARRLERNGETTLFTGQGGDAVFFQMRTPLVAADLRGHGYSARQRMGHVVAIAQWTRQPVWSVLRAYLQRTIASHIEAPKFLSPACRAISDPWLADATHLPPAKQLQIWGLANSRLFFVEGQRDRVASVVHPLLSQPLVEQVLRLPVIALTMGIRDRAMARCAFGKRLPETIRNRPGKGDLAAYYGRLVATSLDLLRPHLLDGRLVQQGLIDRLALEPLLVADRLAWDDAYTELLCAAIIESWVRQWEVRLAKIAVSGQ